MAEEIVNQEGAKSAQKAPDYIQMAVAFHKLARAFYVAITPLMDAAVKAFQDLYSQMEAFHDAEPKQFHDECVIRSQNCPLCGFKAKP